VREIYCGFFMKAGAKTKVKGAGNVHNCFCNHPFWVLGVRKSAEVPEHESYETEPQTRVVLASKVVNPFTCVLSPPFIGRRRDFYILRLPSNLRNIPNVNTYKNVFYIP
jgi:hypothetical protein